MMGSEIENAQSVPAGRNSGMTLQNVPQWKMTNEICREAVRRSGWALEFVPKELLTESL